MIDVKEAMKMIDVSTARGRAEAKGSAIDLGEKPWQVMDALDARSRGYLEISMELAGRCKDHPYSISSEELETVEFVREQLEKLSRMTHEEMIRNYSK